MNAERTIGISVITEIAMLDRVLRAHAAGLGSDFVGYRNHAYRVANLCIALAPAGPDQIEKIAVATAFTISASGLTGHSITSGPR